MLNRQNIFKNILGKFRDTAGLLIPKKHDKRSIKICKVVMIGTIVVFVISLAVLINYLHSKDYALDTFKRIQNDFINRDSDDSLNPLDDNVSNNDGRIKETTVDVNLDIDFNRLLKVNKDVVGWLRIHEMTLSTPVVQGKDNVFYLKTNLYGETDRYGVPFADYRNVFEPDLLSSNTLIYGHHMKGEKLFGELTKYKSQEFYELHPIIRFETPTNKMNWQVIGAFIEEIREDGNYFQYHNFINATADYTITQYVSDVQERSLIETGVKVTEDDKLLTLSTCTYEYDDARFVLVAKLIN